MPVAEADTPHWTAAGLRKTRKQIHFSDRASARKAIINEYFILTYGKLFYSAKWS